MQLQWTVSKNVKNIVTVFMVQIMETDLMCDNCGFQKKSVLIFVWSDLVNMQ